MAELSFYWHDYETFGVVPRRDRPVQFAGVRTDADLNEVGVPMMLYCRPAPDSLPDPESVLITGILPQYALQHGLAEHEFASRIEAELARDGTVGVGYNSIRFDDEVTRYLFWRNLIDPYAREWQNGCGRWDLLDVVRACWALRPEGIEWPLHTEGPHAGKPSFKLEHLSRANGLAHEAAHDALSDVRATIAVARLIKAKQPRLWDFCLKLHKKDAVQAEIGGAKPFLHLSGMYPVERGCLAVVWPLARHPTNKNEVIVWDLAHDPRELLNLDAEQLRLRMYTKQADLPEGVTRLPIKTIHINKSPIVIGSLKTAQPVAQRWGLDMELAMQHASYAAELGQSLDALWPAVFKRGASADSKTHAPDVDEALYEGFVANDDRRTLQRLRELTPTALAAKRSAFTDGRLEEMVFRYRARNYAETLTDDEQQRWHQHRIDRLVNGHGTGVSLQAWFDRIDVLAEAAIEREDERAQALLEQLVDYAEGIMPESD